MSPCSTPRIAALSSRAWHRNQLSAQRSAVQLGVSREPTAEAGRAALRRPHLPLRLRLARRLLRRGREATMAGACAAARVGAAPRQKLTMAAAMNTLE